MTLRIAKPLFLWAAGALFLAPTLALASTWFESTDRTIRARSHSATYDQSRNRMVVFGGFNEFGYTNEVWTLGLPPDPETWVNQVTTSCPFTGEGPSPRARAVTFYDPQGDQLWVWGGYGGSTPINVAGWTLNFATPTPEWCPLGNSGTPPPLPSGGTDVRGAYDSMRHRLVVVSPTHGVYALDLQTSVWTQLYAGDLAPTYIGDYGFNVVYDSVNDRIVVFGGWHDAAGFNCSNEYNHGTAYALPLANPMSWQQVATGGPTEADMSAVYDPGGQRVLVYGGEKCRMTDGAGSITSRVWSLNMAPGGTGWIEMPTDGSSPGARWAHSAILPPNSNKMFVFGGSSHPSGNTNLSTTYYLVPDPAPDTTPPAAISNLFIDFVSPNSTGLVWSAPGDDGNQGIATRYDLRYRTQAITESNFYSSQQVTGEPNPAAPGTVQSMIVTGLASCRRYYWAIKTEDEAGNISSISNVPNAKTVCQAAAFDSEWHPEEPGARIRVVGANPAHESSEIAWAVRSDLAGYPMKLSVYDVRGRLVREIRSGTAEAGSATFRWDLRDDGGGHVASGIYIARLTVGGQQTTKASCRLSVIR